MAHAMSWLWVIPTVSGWYFVGVLGNRRAAEETLKKAAEIFYPNNNSEASVVSMDHLVPAAFNFTTVSTTAIESIELANSPQTSSATGSNMLETYLETRQNMPQISPEPRLKPPLLHRKGTASRSKDRTLGRPNAGDEESPGPIFIYARIFT